MKKRQYTLLSFLLCAQLCVAQRQWTWMEGNRNPDNNGSYGIIGVSAPANTPGTRMGAATWKDNDGNFWIFGGRGNSESSTGLLNDLWKYNISSKQWAWMGGQKTTNTPTQYGILGLPLFQQPGARENAVSWVDNQGNLWMFGGSGYGSDNSETGFMNDLWRYSPSTNSWTWVGGTDELDERGRYGSRGDGSRSNYPGGRFLSVGWKDNDGNLWLLGGFGFGDKDDRNDIGALNDLWRYSPASNEWTWFKGEKDNDAKAHYGRKGDFQNNNTPGGRQGSVGWKDKNGNLWLYGGENSNEFYCDLWVYDPDQNQWAWMSGTDNTNDRPDFDDMGVPTNSGHPGSRTLASGWIDPNGDLWLFGGRGYGGNSGLNSLNNLWKYSIENNNWTYIKGEINNPEPVYGNKGVPNNNNTPGGINNASAWVDDEGLFWLFGGRSDDGYLDQMWNYSPCPSGNITPASASVCEGGTQELTATGGSSYEWRRNNVLIQGQNKAKYKATEPGTYTVLIKNGACAVGAFNTVEITRATAPTGTITPATASICQGGSKVLTATGGTTYEWKRNGTTIQGKKDPTITVTEPGTYSVIITNGGCTGPASNTSVISQDPTPAGTITPAVASLCENSTQVLTATGGTSYEWLRDGEKINGQTGPTISVNISGTYSVIIKGGVCSGPAANTAEVTEEGTGGQRYTDVVAVENNPVQLNARNAGTHFEWTPSTGLDDPSSPNPMATLTKDQQYVVLISSAQGCSVIDTQFVKVNPGNGSNNNKVQVYVPTAFTPNGNSVNDRLRPLGNIGKIDYFKVYNRWGNIVFLTNIIGDGWNGQYKGVRQPSDTYTWLFVGKTIDGQTVKISGKTLLIQ